MTGLTDEELIERYRASGKTAASDDPHINELFRRHYQRVALWCLRQTGDRDRAADLAQEIFSSAFRYLDSFRGDSKFSTWLFTITRNQCRNDWKTRAARQEDESEPIFDQMRDVKAADPLAMLEREDTASVMRTLLQDSLDQTEREVMSLHYVEEMPLDAITRMLGLENASGAKAYIVSARRKLRQAVTRWKAKKGGPLHGKS